MDGNTALTRPVDGSLDTGKAVDTVTVTTKDGKEHPFEYHQRMTAESLKHRIERTGIADSEIETVYVNCDEARFAELSQICHAAFPTLTNFDELPAIEAGVHQIPGKVEFRITDNTFRAIAKIAFHYYLVHSKRGTRGDEPEFTALRQFILGGGRSSDFFPDGLNYFGSPFRPIPGMGIVSSCNWCHLLAADESADTIKAYINLFAAGPAFAREGFQFELGRVPGIIRVPGSRWAHVYEYGRTRNGSKCVGSVRVASLTRLR